MNPFNSGLIAFIQAFKIMFHSDHFAFDLEKRIWIDCEQIFFCSKIIEQGKKGERCRAPSAS